jgi:putative hemolysin
MEVPPPPAAAGSLVIFALIAASGFCSLFDHALRSARKSRLQKEAQDGSKPCRRLLDAVENPDCIFMAIRIWICVLRIAAAFLAGINVTRHAQRPEGGAFLLAALAWAVVLSLCAVFLGEFIPQFIARSAPERIAAALLPLFNALTIPFRPFMSIARRFADFLRSIIPLENLRPGITEDELRLALMEGEKSGIVESKERTMVEGVFYLGDRPVRAFMRHRSEIQWLDVNAAPEDVRARALEYRSQRCFPVADGAPEEIIGAAYLEDIILDQVGGDPRGLRAIMKKAHFVPETMSALKAFESFRRGEVDFLFVMDEYGGFAGVISVRDLVEEIVGELSAPGPEEDPVIRQEDGTWLAGGSVNIDEAAELLSLPGLAAGHGEYHTLAGFVLSMAGELPRAGDSFVYQGFRFRVVDMDGNRIDKLLISREEEKST